MPTNEPTPIKISFLRSIQLGLGISAGAALFVLVFGPVFGAFLRSEAFIHWLGLFTGASL